MYQCNRREESLRNMLHVLHKLERGMSTVRTSLRNLNFQSGMEEKNNENNESKTADYKPGKYKHIEIVS
jgi:hypothetical protein